MRVQRLSRGASLLVSLLVVLALVGIAADSVGAAVTDKQVEQIVTRLNTLNASSPDRANRYWGTLSPEEQAAVTDALAVVDVVVEITDDAASAGAPPEAFVPEASDETQFSAQACYGPNIRTAVGSNRRRLEPPRRHGLPVQPESPGLHEWQRDFGGLVFCLGQ